MNRKTTASTFVAATLVSLAASSAEASLECLLWKSHPYFWQAVVVGKIAKSNGMSEQNCRDIVDGKVVNIGDGWGPVKVLSMNGGKCVCEFLY